MFPIAPAWPRRTLYVDIVNLLADKPWASPGQPDLLSNLPTWFTVTGFDESQAHGIGCAFLNKVYPGSSERKVGVETSILFLT